MYNTSLDLKLIFYNYELTNYYSTFDNLNLFLDRDPGSYLYNHGSSVYNDGFYLESTDS